MIKGQYYSLADTTLVLDLFGKYKLHTMYKLQHNCREDKKMQLNLIDVCIFVWAKKKLPLMQVKRSDH